MTLRADRCDSAFAVEIVAASLREDFSAPVAKLSRARSSTAFEPALGAARRDPARR